MGKKNIPYIEETYDVLLSVPGMQAVRQHWHVQDLDWKQ